MKPMSLELVVRTPGGGVTPSGGPTEAAACHRATVEMSVTQCDRALSARRSDRNATLPATSQVCPEYVQQARFRGSMARIHPHQLPSMP
jgi:hypothetical protein